MPRTLKSHPRLVIAGLTLLALLPFVHRPLFVDDHAVFAQARDLIHHPWVPYARDASIPGWGGQASVGEDNPLVHFYFLAAVIKLFGPEVWKAHLAMLPIHVAGLLAFFSLAKKYVRYPVWATALWLFSPHFWLTAQSLMVDGMLGSLMIIGIAAWISGWEEESTGRLVFAAVVLGLTPLVKYTGLLSWGVIILWMTLEKQWTRGAKAWLLLIPLVFFGAWIIWTRNLYGQNHFLAVARTHMVIPHGRTWLTLALFSVGTTPCLLFPLAIMLNRSIRRFRIDRSVLFLGGWAIAGLIGLAFALDWVCARFLVIVGPPLVLLSVRMLEQCSTRASSRIFRWMTAGVFAVFALALACADYSQASIDPQATADATAWLSQNPTIHGAAYYPGAELGGLSATLPSNVWKPLSPGTAMAKGDIALLPLRTLPAAFFPSCAHAQPVAQFIYPTRNPLRTLDSLSHAGFYGSIWGPWPFTISEGPRDVYLIVVCETP